MFAFTLTRKLNLYLKKKENFLQCYHGISVALAINNSYIKRYMSSSGSPNKYFKTKIVDGVYVITFDTPNSKVRFVYKCNAQSFYFIKMI